MCAGDDVVTDTQHRRKKDFAAFNKLNEFLPQTVPYCEKMSRQTYLSASLISRLGNLRVYVIREK